jgi:hypothetical protein
MRLMRRDGCQGGWAQRIACLWWKCVQDLWWWSRVVKVEVSELDPSNAPFCRGARFVHGVGVKVVATEVWGEVG